MHILHRGASSKDGCIYYTRVQVVNKGCMH